MTIPKSIKIGGKVYTVEITDKLYSGNANVSAEIVYNDLIIRVSPQAQGKMEADILCELRGQKYEQISVIDRLLAELEQLKRALAMMWFAYVNSDKESPHSYETKAVKEAERLLGSWNDCMLKYLNHQEKEK